MQIYAFELQGVRVSMVQANEMFRVVLEQPLVKGQIVCLTECREHARDSFGVCVEAVKREKEIHEHVYAS